VIRSQPAVFNWRVPAGGFVWVDAVSDGRRVRALVEAPAPSLLATSRRYDPLTEAPALFRELAECPLAEEAIRDFAGRYGALGENVVVTEPIAIVGKAESFEVWRRAISTLRAGLWIWQRLTSADREVQKELKRRVRWDRDPSGHLVVLFDSHPHLPLLKQATTDDGYLRVAGVCAGSDHVGGLGRFEEGEVSMPARAFLCELVNNALHGRMSPMLDADKLPAEPLIPGRNPVLASVRWMPDTLLAACWWQLAQTISGVKQQRLCPGCKKWFELDDRARLGKRARSDKTYCKDACRVRFFQDRRETAKRLRAQGKTPRAIAAELGADIDQVKKWVSKKGK
jgi:hypothetical protein